jgi:Fe-S cluster assembly protein SufB
VGVPVVAWADLLFCARPPAIIADEDSYVHYIEGCTAPIHGTDSLHSAVVEIVVKRGARVRCSTIQNWSTDVYNLVTKRAIVQEHGKMEWVDGNIGSTVTMKHPSIYLAAKGRRARPRLSPSPVPGSTRTLERR